MRSDRSDDAGDEEGTATAGDGGTRKPEDGTRRTGRRERGRGLGSRLAPETPYLLGHLAALSVPVALLVWLHPYPLVHPDPLQFRRVGLEMLAEGRLLVTWDPPLRYVPLYLLYALTRPSVALADRLVVLQAAAFSYLLVPLALYAYVATVRSRREGLLAVAASAMATAAGLPPTAVVWHHPQVDLATPAAVLGLALAWLALRARAAGRRRATVGYALATAAVGGVVANTEPWVALFLAAGVASAWAAHRAWLAVATATVVGALAAVPLLWVPNWRVHVTFFVVDVIDPFGPLLSASVLVDAVLSPGTWGTLALLGTAFGLDRAGYPLPGGLVTGFALLAGALTWGVVRVTTLGGIGTRGLVWLLTLGVPAVAVQVRDALPAELRARAGLDRPLADRPSGEWLALYVAEAAVLAVSVLLYLVTFEPPA